MGRWRSVRKESTETGEDSTGHITAHPNEGILFFDSNDLGALIRIFANYSQTSFR